MKILLTTFALISTCILSTAQSNRAETNLLSLTNEVKTQVINNFLSKLKTNYIFQSTISRIQDKFDNFKKSSEFDRIKNPIEFADTLTSILRNTVSDNHLGIIYNPNNLSSEVQGPRPRMRIKENASDNEPVPDNKMRKPVEFKFLDSSIGYLRIDMFDDQQIFYDVVSEAFKQFAESNAMIIDLKNCRGGSPRAENFVISHFFKQGEQFSSIFQRIAEKEIEQKFFSLKEVKNRYLTNPVFILVSEKTFSSAENFTYDMQVLKRGLVVGTNTKGGANPGGEFSLGDSFFAFIPTGRSYSYVTKSNWEGIGITPNFLTDEDNALGKAISEINRK